MEFLRQTLPNSDINLVHCANLSMSYGPPSHTSNITMLFKVYVQLRKPLFSSLTGHLNKGCHVTQEMPRQSVVSEG